MITIKSKIFWLIDIAFLFLTLLWINATAQTIRGENIRYIPDVEVTFSKGVNEYSNGNYEEATRIFEELLNYSPVHQRITASYLMLGKCYYQLHNYKKAISVLGELIKSYPESNYIDDAHHTMGFCYYELGEYINSLKEFLFVADNGTEKKLIERDRNNALKVIDNNITSTELEQLKENVGGEMSSAILTIKLSQRYIEQGDRNSAILLLQNFVQRHPQNPYLATVQELLKRTNLHVPSVEVTLGVILPLSGEYKEQAAGVLAGIQYVQKKFNDTSSIRINLVIKDSEGDIIKSVKAAQDLAKDNRIIAIIGELEQDKTVAIAATLDQWNIPLISPTTSGNGIASINEYTFQLNSDLETRARALAKYAMEELRLNTFATLAPADNYGKDMTDSFAATVDQLGGKIIAQKWYYLDTQDLKRQFHSIRELGFNLVNKDSVFSYYSRELSVFGPFKADKVPVTSINAIFFPCYTEEIQYIAPQFALANIQAQIIGGENWYDFDKLRTNQNYIDGIIFCSGYYFDETDPKFIKFRNDFRLLMKRTPAVMESYGYDSMNVLSNAIAHKQTTREGIRNYLNNLENFLGLRGAVTFHGNNRVNSQVRILTYKTGRIMPLK